MVGHVWTALQAHVRDQLWALTAARFVCSSAVLLVPTMLMGATPPLVVRSSLARGMLVGPRGGVVLSRRVRTMVAATDAPRLVNTRPWAFAPRRRRAAADSSGFSDRDSARRGG